MRHRKFTFKIGRKPAHVRSLLANAVCSLIKHRRIKTTLVKAKQIRVLADQMVTLGKKGTLHARRRAISKLKQVSTVAILFDEIAPGFQKRQGGYTRIYRLGPRIGDGAEMALIEFVESDDIVASRAPVAEATVEVEATAVVEAEETATEETEAVAEEETVEADAVEDEVAEEAAEAEVAEEAAEAEVAEEAAAEDSSGE